MEPDPSLDPRLLQHSGAHVRGTGSSPSITILPCDTQRNSSVTDDICVFTERGVEEEEWLTPRSSPVEVRGTVPRGGIRRGRRRRQDLSCSVLSWLGARSGPCLRGSARARNQGSCCTIAALRPGFHHQHLVSCTYGCRGTSEVSPLALARGIVCTIGPAPQTHKGSLCPAQGHPATRAGERPRAQGSSQGPPAATPALQLPAVIGRGCRQSGHERQSPCLRKRH